MTEALKIMGAVEFKSGGEPISMFLHRIQERAGLIVQGRLSLTKGDHALFIGEAKAFLREKGYDSFNEAHNAFGVYVAAYDSGDPSATIKAEAPTEHEAWEKAVRAVGEET